MPLSFPLAIIDFEASGLSGYPIEVGIAIARPGDPDVEIWSSLIRPTLFWLETMSWDPVAAQIHGITRAELKKAPAPFDVARDLNRTLASIGVAYCDGWRHDHRWLHLLMEESPDACAFRLEDISALGRRLNIAPSTLFHRDANQGPDRHRAGPDALELLNRALRLAS